MIGRKEKRGERREEERRGEKRRGEEKRGEERRREEKRGEGSGEEKRREGRGEKRRETVQILRYKRCGNKKNKWIKSGPAVLCPHQARQNKIKCNSMQFNSMQRNAKLQYTLPVPVQCDTTQCNFSNSK